MPSDTQIANRAEKDLNKYQAKTGEARKQADNDSGTNAMAENEFAKYGAELKDGDELSTNAGFNKRIPPSEGGETDDRGRQTRGQHFDGFGGPRDKMQETGSN